ncbi:hypothetical protein J1N35_028192 [Gossypium stocksii]|uniref:Uncharacterized protein n=1 Tax=Gossypium stocksii TaxID=47602 RepID=A0A9D3ZSG3_9ROSI|nr:hypothetical protein J1N35_028192 [Gossypium stocksii]
MDRNEVVVCVLLMSNESLIKEEIKKELAEMKLMLKKLTTSSNKLEDILVDGKRDQGRRGLGFVDKEVGERSKLVLVKPFKKNVLPDKGIFVKKTSFKEVGERSRLVLFNPFKKNVLPHKMIFHYYGALSHIIPHCFKMLHELRWKNTMPKAVPTPHGITTLGFISFSQVQVFD